MLDQNTDRMWYVIGAVIIGAAIILILNNTFPQLFASVGNTFKDKTEQTMDIVDGIMPQTKDKTLIASNEVFYYNSTLDTYDAASNTWTIDLNSVPEGSAWHIMSGLTIDAKRLEIPYGKSAKVSYDLFVPDGVSGVPVISDINTYPTDPSVPKWNANDNHSIESVVYSKGDKMAPVAGGQWHSIWFTYSNQSVANTQKVSLYDASRIGMQNTTGEVLSVKIKNIRVAIY